jgi:Holliday junction resolvase-like predicted endonuclease
MLFERNLYVSILKLSQNAEILIDDLKINAKLPLETIFAALTKLHLEEILNLSSKSVEMQTQGRLKLAVKALQLGADITQVSEALCWQEFEEMATIALAGNGFTVAKNVRFKHGDRRFEIDAVGCKKPLVVCIDCKHWQKAMAPSTIKTVVEAQSKRTQALAEALPNGSLNLDCAKWSQAKFVPAVLSLVASQQKFYHNVPIVSVLQIQDFIHQLPLYIDQLQMYPKTFQHLTDNL